MSKRIIASLLIALLSGHALGAPIGTPKHTISWPGRNAAQQKTPSKPTVDRAVVTPTAIAPKPEVKPKTETATAPEEPLNTDILQLSPYPVNGTITWSKNADQELKRFYDEISSRSNKILHRSRLFWQDTTDSNADITGPIAAVKYCENLIINVDELAIGGFRVPTQIEIKKSRKIEFSTEGVNAPEPSSDTDESGKLLGVFSARSSNKNNIDFTRCVSDKLTFKNSTPHDIALFLSKRKQDYLKSLERAINIKYGKPVLVTSLQTNRLSVDLTSREIKESTYSTQSQLQKALKTQPNILSKVVSAKDKSITIKGVYNFKYETIIELKINKRLQGFSLRKMNANYAIVDTSKKKKNNSAWRNKNSTFMIFPYQIGNIYHELDKGTKIYFSIPRIISRKFDFGGSFVGTWDTSLENIKLKNIAPSHKDFSLFEFSAESEITIEKPNFDKLQETINTKGFVPIVKLTLSDGQVRFWSIGEIDSYKNNAAKKKAQKLQPAKPVAKLQAPKPAPKEKSSRPLKPDPKKILALSYNSISELNKFIVQYPGTEHTAKATKQIFDLSYNSIDQLNTFVTQHPTSELKGPAVTQILALSYGSTEALNQFVKDHPDSSLVPKANRQIITLDKQREQEELAYIEYKKDHAYGQIIGPRTIDSAKFAGGLIWQDVAINSSRKSHTFSTAEKYCADLTLLKSDKWRLPSRADFEKLGSDISQLTHRAYSTNRYNFYFTETDGCNQGNKSKLPANQCVYMADITANKTPYISKKNKTSPASVRCVLSTYSYNRNQKKLASSYVKAGGFTGYLNSFRATGNQANIQKAYKYGKGQGDKAKIELALIEHFGIESAFEVTGELYGSDNPGSKEPTVDTWSVSSIEPDGSATVNITASKKGSSNIHLKHGAFKMKVHVRLDLSYRSTKAGSKNIQLEHMEQTGWITLDKQNGFSNSTQLDFGVIHHPQADRKKPSNSRTLESIKPTIVFDGIEQI